MTGYWARQRAVATLILSVVVALAASFLFVYPSILQQANNYNAQSIYKNSDIDFIAPEPSFDQVKELPGTNGIDKIFPFFLTKTEVQVNGNSRTTTVLLSDDFENVDATMYNQNRLIEKSDSNDDNSILVDWQFCHDTSAGIGDTVSIAIGGNNAEFRISGIYESNSIYDGGAVLAKISGDQMNAIAKQSNNNGYSGMYVVASDYSACKAYLTSEYRPLGRLKDKSQFTDEAQYQVHYDAIMSSGYANEITDFRAREESLTRSSGIMMVLIGALLAFAIIIVFNLLMARRGCEKVYFTKHCIPKGQNVNSYYNTASIAETVLMICLYGVFMTLRLKTANQYIPGSALGIKVAVVPVAIIIAEIISGAMNRSMVSGITREYELELKRKREAEARKAAAQAAHDEEKYSDNPDMRPVEKN